MEEKKSPVYITRKYQYDKADRIVQVSRDGQPVQIRFGYDPAGNLVSRETEIISPGTRCPEPAVSLEAGQILCPSCHHQVSPGKKFCPQCGTPLRPE
jgi:YD repeat-containing protein